MISDLEKDSGKKKFLNYKSPGSDSAIIGINY